MMLNRLLRRDSRGIGAVEFALVAPVLISFIIGVSQLGRMFFANADMKSAIAAGARVASVYPVPDDDAILDAIDQRLLRDGAENRTQTAVARGTDANGNPYIEITMSYSVPLEFIFFSPPPVTLHDTRRVFTQVETANGTTYSTSASTTTTGGTTSSTGSTSTGGETSSTSATSAGGSTGSTSTSSTSTGSTSTSSTSTSSTSSGSTGSTTSSTSSGSNGSSGGHAHGSCRRCT